MNHKKNKFLVAFIAVLVVGLASWYIHKRSACIENISYMTPTPLESVEYYSLIVEKEDGNYSFSKHKTFDEAYRSCMAK